MKQAEKSRKQVKMNATQNQTKSGYNEIERCVSSYRGSLGYQNNSINANVRNQGKHGVARSGNAVKRTKNDGCSQVKLASPRVMQWRVRSGKFNDGNASK